MIHRDDRQNRTRNTYLPTRRSYRSCIANIHRRLQEHEISRCNTRDRCRNLSQFLPASMYICCKRFQSLRRRSARGKTKRRGGGKEKETEEEGFWHGQEHLAPCDRFDPEYGALMAIVCPSHTLLAISSESSRGIGNAVDKEWR